jgi:glycylpeptide N-tetradecanoyltransferase
MNKYSFWINKPITVSKNCKFENILSSNELLNKLNKEIELNRFQLDYSVIESKDLTIDKITNIVNFININYITSKDDLLKYVYTNELFSFYCNNALILEFYPKGNNTIIGYIIGKRSDISLYNKILQSSEVNFLCVVPRLRNIGISSYMINVISKEIVLKYDINSAHYTIGTKIKSPYFGEKILYHRCINIPQLLKTQFLADYNENVLIKMYNTFSYSDKFKSIHKIKYINNQDVNDNLIDELYNTYIEYCKNTYEMYEVITLCEFKKTFTNKMFHHFIIYRNEEIVSYICFFRLDSYNKNTKSIFRSGFYYYMFLKDKESINFINSFEFINEYIYKNDIFDVLTLSDIFKINYNEIKFIKGTGILRYYFYNIKCPLVQNDKNGLITI